jgi:hypothetical protein
MTFKDMVASDINNVFLNCDEFADKHQIEGATITCVISTDDTLPIAGGYALGVASGSLLIYCAIDAIEQKYPGEGLNIDGAEYVIENWNEQMGMWVITVNNTLGV